MKLVFDTNVLIAALIARGLCADLLEHCVLTHTIRDLNEAFAWLPKSAYSAEAKPLAELARRKHRGPQHIGDLLIPLLIRLGVSIEKEVESNTSKARRSD